MKNNLSTTLAVGALLLLGACSKNDHSSPAPPPTKIK